MNQTESQHFLVDTNIVIYFISDGDWKQPYELLLQGKTLYISFMTLAEILEGAYHRNLSEKNIAKLKKRLHDEYSVIPFTEEICDRFGWIRSVRRNRPISVPDALIAATSMAYGLPLVTHNKKDFEDISPELKIVSEYQ